MAGEERVSKVGVKLFGLYYSRLVAKVANLGRDSAQEPDEHEVVYDESLSHLEANVVTSLLVSASWQRTQYKDMVMHAPVLDIDFPIRAVESSTHGHFHLFMDRSMTWAQYKKLLNALVEAEIIEPGYRDASLERGYTAVRLPHVTKEDLP